jgi:hypothetical protein
MNAARLRLVEALRRGEAKLAVEIARERGGWNFGFGSGVEAATRRAWAELLPQAVIKAARATQRSNGAPNE